MSDVLCIYYSRTGNTKKTIEEMAQALGAEVVELQDGIDRSGWGGWLRSGLDAMRKSVKPVRKLETKRSLDQYRLVIIATPVWAGRCSSVVRSFLKEYGGKLRRRFPAERLCGLRLLAGRISASGKGNFESAVGLRSFFKEIGKEHPHVG